VGSPTETLNVSRARIWLKKRLLLAIAQFDICLVWHNFISAHTTKYALFIGGEIADSELIESKY